MTRARGRPTKRQTRARLGNVLYWTGNLLALIAAGLAVYVWQYEHNEFAGRIILIAGVLVWLIGCACWDGLVGR